MFADNEKLIAAQHTVNVFISAECVSVSLENETRSICAWQVWFCKITTAWTQNMERYCVTEVMITVETEATNVGMLVL